MGIVNYSYRQVLISIVFSIISRFFSWMLGGLFFSQFYCKLMSLNSRHEFHLYLLKLRIRKSEIAKQLKKFLQSCMSLFYLYLSVSLPLVLSFCLSLCCIFSVIFCIVTRKELHQFLIKFCFYHNINLLCFIQLWKNESEEFRGENQQTE